MGEPAQKQEPAQEAKVLVEVLKGKVARLQAEVGEKGALAKGSFPRSRDKFAAWERAKKDWQAAMAELRAAKETLAKLSTSSSLNGSDPKWDLIREAWHVLNELEERGVDIGDRAEALIEDIEFHVPAWKLNEDSRRMSDTSSPGRGGSDE